MRGWRRTCLHPTCQPTCWRPCTRTAAPERRRPLLARLRPSALLTPATTAMRTIRRTAAASAGSGVAGGGDGAGVLAGPLARANPPAPVLPVSPLPLYQSSTLLFAADQSDPCKTNDSMQLCKYAQGPLQYAAAPPPQSYISNKPQPLLFTLRPPPALGRPARGPKATWCPRCRAAGTPAAQSAGVGGAESRREGVIATGRMSCGQAGGQAHQHPPSHPPTHLRVVHKQVDLGAQGAHIPARAGDMGVCVCARWEQGRGAVLTGRPRCTPAAVDLIPSARLLSATPHRTRQTRAGLRPQTSVAPGPGPAPAAAPRRCATRLARPGPPR